MNGADIITLVTVFVLSAFVGFEVISKVPSILHTPLMSGTNAVHGVVLVGSMAILGTAHGAIEITLGFVAVVLSTVNVVGGFVVTDRMLEMFKGRQPGRPAEREEAPAPGPAPAREQVAVAPEPPREPEPVIGPDPAETDQEPEVTAEVGGQPQPRARRTSPDEPTEFLSPEDLPPPPLGSEATQVMPRTVAPSDETEAVEIEKNEGGQP